jgi:hypothetical protein
LKFRVSSNKTRKAKKMRGRKNKKRPYAIYPSATPSESVENRMKLKSGCEGRVEACSSAK